jgi:RNA 3'-terminal phosphate cyclase (RTC), insert domain
LYFIPHRDGIAFILRSPGFGITLVAETTNGSFLSAEACSHPLGSTEGRVAADVLGVTAARRLLEEIYKVCNGRRMCNINNAMDWFTNVSLSCSLFTASTPLVSEPSLIT